MRFYKVSGTFVTLFWYPVWQSMRGAVAGRDAVWKRFLRSVQLYPPSAAPGVHPIAFLVIAGRNLITITIARALHWGSSPGFNKRRLGGKIYMRRFAVERGARPAVAGSLSFMLVLLRVQGRGRASLAPIIASCSTLLGSATALATFCGRRPIFLGLNWQSYQAPGLPVRELLASGSSCASGPRAWVRRVPAALPRAGRRRVLWQRIGGANAGGVG